MKKLQRDKVLIHPHDHKKISDWQKIFKFLEENIDFGEINSFLELGAGTGNLANFVLSKNPRAKVICEDINEQFLQIIKERNSAIEILKHDINEKLPFGDNTFDLVSCIGVLQYSSVKHPLGAIAEMRRVSKNYILLDCFPRYSSWVLFEKIFYPGYNPKRKSSSEMERIFRRYNLKLVSKAGIRTPFSKTFPFSGKTVLFLLKR